jgi:enoyl-CoA hydratase/carnithine racemase
LREAAVGLARSIAARGPLAVRAARAAVLAGLGRPEDEAMRIEFEHFIAVMRSADAVEGGTAFAERRDPVYEGR